MAGCIRPATPGFIVTLAATVLLAIVSFSVPWFKSVFFLRASLQFENVSGNITFGVLGYCLELANGTTCSSPKVGYELDINGLVGNNLPISIPVTLVKWLTYALVLHIVALALSAGSAVFGLLAHIREMAMTCCSSCIAGMAAAVALLAFIFDLAFFFAARARINAVPGGSATIGNGIWLTLAAWVLLFVSGCFYTLGRCCISGRGPRNNNNNNWDKGQPQPAAGPQKFDQMRLDAIKAENDRKARQAAGEGGLPSFGEYDSTVPLRAVIDGDEVYIDDGSHQPYKDQPAAGAYGHQPSNTGYHPTGYAQAPPGNRAVDEYYNPTVAAATSYPPQSAPPQRQPSTYTQSTTAYAPSGYNQYDAAGSQYGQHQGYGQPHYAGSPPPMPVPDSQYLTPNAQYAPDRYLNASPANYGHSQGGTSYHSAHQQFPSEQYDPYSAPPQAAPVTDPYGYHQGGSAYQAGPSDPHAYTASPPPMEPPIYDMQHSQPPGAWGAKN